MADLPKLSPLRLFVSLSIPEHVRPVIAQEQTKLRRLLDRSRISWTKTDQFHLTLRFLGDIQSDRIEALTKALQNACRDFTPLHLHAGKSGVFPNARSPRVIWIGIEDREGALLRLQEAIVLATNAFTSEPAKEKFAGHVTLGRIKSIDRHEAEVLARVLSALTIGIRGEWVAESFQLMRSDLSPQGACHSKLASFPLTTGLPDNAVSEHR